MSSGSDRCLETRARPKATRPIGRRFRLPDALPVYSVHVR